MADLLTTRQVTDLLKIDRTTIYRMVESGQLSAIRVGKQWRFAQTDIDRFLVAPTALVTVSPTKHAVPADKNHAPFHPAAESVSSAHATLERPLGELLPLGPAQMIQDLIANVLGVTIVMTDMQGHPITTVSNVCGLYNTLLTDADAVVHCIQEWQQIAGRVSLEPKFMSNQMGLLCARGLIRAGNLLKGMVFFGGIAPDQWPPGKESVGAIAAHFHVPLLVLTPHIDEVYRLDQRRRDFVLSFVQPIADIFSLLLEDRSALCSQITTLQALLPAKPA